MGLSFWESDHFSNSDYVILGCGIVGLSTAIHLKKANIHANVVVIDRSWPPHGASTKNAGFMCFGSPTEILDDIDQNGAAIAMEIFEKRWLGRDTLFSLIDPAQIDYKQTGGLELFENNNLLAKNEIDCLNDLIYSKINVSEYFKYVDNYSFKNFDNKAILATAEGSINPMKLILCLKEEANKLGIQFIFKEVKYIDRSNKVLILDKDTRLPYKKILVTLNAFASRLFPELLDVNAARNNVIVTSPLQKFKVDHVVHIDCGYMYMRMIDNRLLFGGGRNKFTESEFTDDMTVNTAITNYLHLYLIDKFNIKEHFTIESTWAGILGVGNAKSPIIKQLDEFTFVGVRMGGMGVAIGALVGKELAAISI